MGVYATRAQRAAREAARWEGIAHQVAGQLQRFRRHPHSRRVALLRALSRAARRRQPAALLRAGAAYLRLTRVIPPGCYALGRAPGPTVYLDGERVRGRLARVALGVWHPQVYR
jgi:hypothetical protein